MQKDTKQIGYEIGKLIDLLMATWLLLTVVCIILLSGLFMWQCYQYFYNHHWFTISILDALSFLGFDRICTPNECQGLYQFTASISIYFSLLILVFGFYFLNLLRGISRH